MLAGTSQLQHVIGPKQTVSHLVANCAGWAIISIWVHLASVVGFPNGSVVKNPLAMPETHETQV